MKKIYLLIGAPGSGKTSAMEAINSSTISHYSIGARYRQLSETNSELGKEIKSYIDYGKVVPIPIAEKVLKGFIEEGRERIVIDAFPRDMEQVHLLKRILNGTAELVRVIEIMVDQQEALNRITKRARGSDDDPKKFKDRMLVYNNEIAEIRTYYKSQNKYISIESKNHLSETVENLRTIIFSNTHE